MKPLYTYWSRLLAVALLVAAGLGLRPAQAQPTFVHSQLLSSNNGTRVIGMAQGLQGQTYALIKFVDSVRVGTVVRYSQPGQYGQRYGSLLVCFDSLHQVAWTRLATPVTYPSAGPSSVQVDGLGNVWVCGLFGGYSSPNTLQLEGSPTPLQSSAPYYNVWVANYSPTGTLRWATALTEPCGSLPPWLATTRAGNAYLVHTRYDRTVGVPPPPTSGSIVGSDIKLLKFDTNGQVLASRIDAQTAPAFIYYIISSLACDPVTERLYLTGVCAAPTTLGNVPLPAGPNGRRSPSLAAYAPDLTPLWAQHCPVQTGPLATDQIAGSLSNLQVGPQGSLWLTASYRDRLTIDTATFAHPAPALGPYDRNASRVVSLSATGRFQWSSPLGLLPTGWEQVMSTRPDAYYLLGSTDIPFALGNYLALPGPPRLPSQGSGNQSHPYIAALAPTGAPVWLRQPNVDSTTYLYQTAMHVAANGDVVLAGTATHSFSWDYAAWQPAPSSLRYQTNVFVLWSAPGTGPLPRLQFLPQAGAPGTSVVLNGHDFQNTTAVHFNGFAASFRVSPNGDQIVATVPTGARTGLITISTPTGTQTTTTAFRVSAPLGTQAAARATVGMYPNPLPRHGTLTVASAAVVQQLTVFDALGRVVQQAAPGQANPQLTLAVPSPGLYSVRIVSSAGTVVQRLAVE